MKKVLSLLLAFVFLQVQTWALSGGPVFGGRTAQGVSGAYAGVLVPLSTDVVEFPNVAAGAIVPTGANLNANTLGIFVIDIPTEGVSTGTFLFFQNGEAFFGTIQGVVDPLTVRLTALLAGAAVFNQGGFEFLAPASAVGRIDASLASRGGRSSSLRRLQGEAVVELQGFIPDASPNGFGLGVLREINFAVDGFKQSDVTSGAAITAPPTTGITPPTTP